MKAFASGEELRDYICANMFDGCDEGMLTVKTSIFLDDLVELFTESEPAPKRDEPVAVVEMNDGTYPVPKWCSVSLIDKYPVGTLLYALPATERDAWQPIETAPKDGPCKDVLLWVPTLHGTGGPVLAHWAFGGGEDQPRFGPAWFFWSGYSFCELSGKPTHWQPLPPAPEK